MASEVGTSATPGAGPASPSARAARRRRAGVAAGALVLVALLAALFLLLRETPGATLAQAVDTTVDRGTALTTITGTLRDAPLVGDVTLSVAHGELDLAGQRARLRRELPLLSGRDLPGLGEIDDVELLYADGGAWLRGPLDTKRSWLRLRDAQDEAAASAPGLGNPLALIALVRAVEGTPQEVDGETVGGVDTTRYRVTVDLDALDGELGVGSRRLLDSLRTLHEDGRLPMDIWVDGDRLIRRIAYQVETDFSGLPRLTLGTQVDLESHGTEVAITPPDDEQVVEVSASALRELAPIRLLREWWERMPFSGD